MGDNDIQGTVTDGSGNALSGVTVSLFEHGGSDVVHTTTDSNGVYVFDSDDIIGSGPWHIAARYDDADGNYNAFSKPYVQGTIEYPATIPDSTIHRWAMGEGSGGTVSDSIGTYNGTISGPTWLEGNWIENYALDGNSSGHVDIGTLGSFGSSISNNGCSIAATVEFDSLSDTQCIMHHDNSNDSMRFQFSNKFSDFNNDEMAFRIRDSGGTTSQAITNTLSVGVKYRIVGTYDPNGGTAIYVNGSQQGSSSNTVGSTSNFDQTAPLFARRKGGGALEAFLDGRLDDVIICNEPLTETEIQDDYDRQPWSGNEDGGGGTTSVATTNGGWHYYMPPKQFGDSGSTYIGYVNTNGETIAHSYDGTDDTTHVLDVTGSKTGSDHFSPSFTPLSNGNLLASWQNTKGIHVSVTTNGYDVTSFNSPITLADSASYPQCIQLGSEDGRIYAYYRGKSNGNRPVEHQYSDDNGSTWSSETLVTDDSDNWQYPMIRKHNDSQIHMVITRNPLHVSDNSAWYCYYENGSYYTADGSLIADESGLPLNLSDLDLVYDKSSTGYDSRVSEMRLDSNGNPYIVLNEFRSGMSDHRYRYHYWNGSSWEGHEILSTSPLNSGGEYWGGMSLNPANLSEVFVSRDDGNGSFEIEKAITSDGGSSWSFESITSGTTNDQFRPRAVTNPQDGWNLTWMDGYLEDWDDWSANLQTNR